MLEWNSAKNGPLKRSTVLPHFSPVGSDGTCFRVTFLIFCFKSQAKPVGLTEEKVKLAWAWCSRTVSSSAGSQRHRSQPGVTPNSSASGTFYSKYSTQIDRKNSHKIKVKHTEKSKHRCFQQRF